MSFVVARDERSHSKAEEFSGEAGENAPSHGRVMVDMSMCPVNRRRAATPSEGRRSPMTLAIEVETETGRYEAGALVVAAGAWTGKVLAEFGFADLAVPQRQVVGWFKDNGSRFAPAAFPVFILECPEAGTFYGIPERATGEGFKVGRFRHRLETVDPDTIDRRIAPEDEAVLTSLDRYLATPMGAPVDAKTCMFVNSPDEHFIVDLLPAHRNVAVSAGFSGHGYKFCSGIGEILADLALHGATPHDTRLFSLARCALTTPAPCWR
jgi:sarcosine oxidase